MGADRENIVTATLYVGHLDKIAFEGYESFLNPLQVK